jgi:ubiquinone/menaquinone biosynthesis C-methylase UbiE
MSPIPAALHDDPIQSRVAQHYARADLERTILDALTAAGKDIDRLGLDDLLPVDEFHTGGRQATVEFARQLGITSDMHLLDIGCGIGGPSRFFAGTFRCRVTGIDLTMDYVRTAEALARRVGLADRVCYRQASALALPFADESFDGAYMMHVGMNIEDKHALFGEIRRVLRPGAVFALYDVMRVGAGDVRFPVHWATTAETSFLAEAAEYREALAAAGFEVIKERDRGDFARQACAAATARTAESNGRPPLGTHLLMKHDVSLKLVNVMKALESGTIAPVEIIARVRMPA